MSEIIHYSFLPTLEDTITAEKYCQQIEEMHEKLKIRRPALINRYGSILLHDNTRSHASRTTIIKLNELNYEIANHPYSPDLSPTDYHKYFQTFSWIIF